MVGSAIWSKLIREGFVNLTGRTSSELDLRNQQAVRDFFTEEKPEIVIDAAARVGGILANNEYPYAFLMENLQIQNNLIDTALLHDVRQFIFLGSSCIYPKMAPQPIKEDYLLGNKYLRSFLMQFYVLYLDQIPDKLREDSLQNQVNIWQQEDLSA